MAKERQWELKMGCGPHIDRSTGERVVYEPGEVIHSTQDLNKLFPHKFIELGISKKATIKKKSKLRQTEAEPTTLNDDDSEQEVKKLKSTKKARGEDEEDEAEIDDEVEDGVVFDKGKKKKSKFGKEVTADFEAAVKADLKVFRRKGKYTVVDADTPDKPISKPGKLKSEKQTAEFIQGYLSASKGE